MILTGCQNNPLPVSYCPPVVKPTKDEAAYIRSGKAKELNGVHNRWRKQQEDILKNCYPEKWEEYLKLKK